jgi:hypothetical protein
MLTGQRQPNSSQEEEDEEEEEEEEAEEEEEEEKGGGGRERGYFCPILYSFRKTAGICVVTKDDI